MKNYIVQLAVLFLLMISLSSFTTGKEENHLDFEVRTLSNYESQFVVGPSDYWLEIKTESDDLNLIYQVLDRAGQEIIKGRINHHTANVDISHLPSGHYQIVLSNGETKCLKKIELL